MAAERERERNKGGGLTKREFLMENFSINPHLQREIIIIKGREAGKEESRGEGRGQAIAAISWTKVSTGRQQKCLCPG